MRLSSNPAVYIPRGLDRVAVLRRMGSFNVLLLLTCLVTLVELAYVLSGQAVVLAVAAVLTVAGVDGLLRTNPSADLRDPRDSVPFVVVPGLFSLGAGVFLRYTLSGYWAIPAVVLAGAALGGIIDAEYRSLSAEGEQLLTLRLILNLAAYLSAFALFTALYSQSLPLLLSAVLVAAVSLLIGFDVLHEAGLSIRTLALYAATLGFIMLETRWALSFLSLSGWLGGVFVLIVFYVASQSMQSYLTTRLDRRAAMEYSVVAAVGVLLVVLGRVLSHG
jgi:hypothetical protein